MSSIDDPLQLNPGDDNNDVIVRPRRGRALSVREYREAPETETDLAAVMEYFWILWRHKWVLVVGLVVGALAGLGISLMMTPMYRARTSLEIQKSAEPFGDQVGPARGSLATQTQLLQSGTMRERAASKINDKTDVETPEIVGPLASLRKLLRMKEPAKMVSWGEAVGMAAGNLSVVTPKESDILVIQSDSANPAAAAAFSDSLAREYIEVAKEQRLDSYRDTGSFMTAAQQELKGKLESSEQRLAKYAKEKGLIFTSGTNNISEDKLRGLQAELMNATADRIRKQAMAESSASSSTESLPSVLDSGPMAQYQAKIVDLKRELAQLSATLTPAHYRTQQVQAQIDELEGAREKERTNIVSRIKIEFQAAVKRETQLRHDYDAQAQVLAGQSDELIEYNILQREVDTNKKLYEETLTQGKSVSLASAMRTSSARIIDLAGVPNTPVAPNLPFVVVLGMMGGSFCGAAFVIIRARSDLRIQAPGVLEVQLNLRELGVIPTASSDTTLRKLYASRGARGETKRGTLLGAGKDSGDCLEMVTLSQKPSTMAEAFRSTMASILFAGDDAERPRVLVFTSASPGEGKSTVVSNLAIALAEINQRVLLIDADMRLPRVHSIFDVPNSFGLSDVLHDRDPVRDYAEETLVRKTRIPNLFVLPAGPARTNLSRLLHSSRLNELLKRFRDSFDIVIIDTAPVLNAPDARILGRAADAVVLVVRAHQTHQEAALAAVSCFAEDGTRILGTILNDWNPSMSMQGYGGGYYGSGGYYPQK